MAQPNESRDFIPVRMLDKSVGEYGRDFAECLFLKLAWLTMTIDHIILCAI